MFKEAYPDNFRAYEAACKNGEIRVGKIFAFFRSDMLGPKWIINFPTKVHWKNNSKIEWIIDGLKDLRAFIERENIKSIAIPPLGAGNGKLEWASVREAIERELKSLDGVQVIVYQPTAQYHNVAKTSGVERLTPARALVVELIRKYSILGLDCTILEVHKLSYFLERSIEISNISNPLNLQFRANKFGPYTQKLTHLLNSLDGSYLHSGKRLSDASPFDLIWFDEEKKDKLEVYLKADEVKQFTPALEATCRLIDGFQSPLGMELLATVDWLIKDGCEAALAPVKLSLSKWPGGANSAKRKLAIFDDRMLELAIPKVAKFGKAGCAI